MFSKTEFHMYSLRKSDFRCKSLVEKFVYTLHSMTERPRVYTVRPSVRFIFELFQ